MILVMCLRTTRSLRVAIYVSIWGICFVTVQFGLRATLKQPAVGLVSQGLRAPLSAAASLEPHGKEDSRKAEGSENKGPDDLEKKVGGVKAGDGVQVSGGGDGFSSSQEAEMATWRGGWGWVPSAMSTDGA